MLGQRQGVDDFQAHAAGGEEVDSHQHPIVELGLGVDDRDNEPWELLGQGDVIGENTDSMPAVIPPIFPCCSNTISSWPSFAGNAAEPRPDKPEPITATFIDAPDTTGMQNI